jgi:phospholipid-binding lipoprotein MlaA
MPWSQIDWGWRIAYVALSVLDTRADLIAHEEMIDNSVDPYITSRDFYLQYVEGQVIGKEGIIEAQKAKDLEDQKNLDSYMDEIDE